MIRWLRRRAIELLIEVVHLAAALAFPVLLPRRPVGRWYRVGAVPWVSCARNAYKRWNAGDPKSPCDIL
jgi:hypothetical protein